MDSHCVKGVFYSAFVRKCTNKCKHRFGVQLLQNPPLCSSTDRFVICTSTLLYVCSNNHRGGNTY
jgi:hypothetical protein